jgi:hypothetical protein
LKIQSTPTGELFVWGLDKNHLLVYPIKNETRNFEASENVKAITNGYGETICQTHLGHDIRIETSTSAFDSWEWDLIFDCLGLPEIEVGLNGVTRFEIQMSDTQVARLTKIKF